MKTSIFQRYDPFVQLIVLMLLGFVSVSLFIGLGNLLIQTIWGLNVMEDLNVLRQYNDPNVVSANKILLFLQHLGLFVLPPLVFAQLVSVNWKRYLWMQKPTDNRSFGFTVLLMILAMLPINLMVHWNESIQFPEALQWLERVFQAAEAQAAELTQAILADTRWSSLFINLFLIALVPAIGEELMFRAGIQNILRRWTGNHHAAIWISAFLFSTLHFQFYGFLPRMVLGALFGYILVWSGSIWVPVLAHFINNATAVCLHFAIAVGVMSPEVEDWGTGNPGQYFAMLSGALMIGVIWWWRKSRDGRPIPDANDQAQEEDV